MPQYYRTDLEEWCDDYFEKEKMLSKRKTFGCPAYYWNRKMVSFCHGDGIGVKLRPERVRQKLADDPEVYFPFNPGDGIMKNWLIIVHAETEQYETEIPLFEESLDQMRNS